MLDNKDKSNENKGDVDKFQLMLQLVEFSAKRACVKVFDIALLWSAKRNLIYFL